MPHRPALRSRIGERLFGGASGGVFRGMATLALGSGIGRVIGFASIPVLTRLYTPEDFGALAIFTALVAILAPLVSLRYVLALPLPRHDGVAMNLLVVAGGLILALTALVTLTLWLWRDSLLDLVSMQVLAAWWWLIALGVLGTATYELLTMWATRKRSYKVIAQTNVAQSASGEIVKIALGLAAFQSAGLLLGQTVAKAGGIGRLFREFASDLRANWRHVRGPRLRKVAWRHRGFPIWRVPSQFLMVFSAQAPVMLMAGLYDAQTTGQFALAMMALSVPVGLLGHSAGKALYGEAAVLIITDPRKVTIIARQVQSRLLIIALIPSIALFFFSETAFAFLFGFKWKDAGAFASLLSIGIMFQFTSAPMIQLMNIFSSQILFLIINSLRLAGLGVIFSYAATRVMEPTSTVMLYSIFTAVFYLFVSFFIIARLRAYKCLI